MQLTLGRPIKMGRRLICDPILAQSLASVMRWLFGARSETRVDWLELEGDEFARLGSASHIRQPLRRRRAVPSEASDRLATLICGHCARTPRREQYWLPVCECTIQ